MPQFGVMRYHEGDVTWTQRIDVPKNAPPGEYPIAGLIGYQVCESGGPALRVAARRAIRRHAEGRRRTQHNGCAAHVRPRRKLPKVAAAAATFADFYGDKPQATTAPELRRPPPR